MGKMASMLTSDLQGLLVFFHCLVLAGTSHSHHQELCLTWLNGMYTSGKYNVMFYAEDGGGGICILEVNISGSAPPISMKRIPL